MLRIRLRRVGAKKQPSYRIVVADSRAPRDGRVLETIGHYNPLTDPPTISIDEDRLEFWQARGAQCSDALSQVLATYRRLKAEEAVSEEVTTPEQAVADESDGAAGTESDIEAEVDEKTETSDAEQTAAEAQGSRAEDNTD